MKKEEFRMKKTVSLILALALVLTAVIAVTTSASADWTAYSASPNGGNVTVYVAPTKNSEVLGTVKYGETLNALYSVNGKWVCVDWNGGLGYVMNRYLSVNKPAEVPIRVNSKKEAKKLREEQASEHAVEEPFEVAVVTTRASSSINFRVGPSRETARIGKLWDGQELIVIGETNKWYKCTDPLTNLTGYVFKQYTSPIFRPTVAKQEAVTDANDQLGRLSVNGEFDLTCKLPESYKMQVINAKGNSVLALITSEDITKPDLTLSIAFEDIYKDVQRLNDLPEKDLKDLEESFKVVDDVDISYGETAHGTKLLICKENDGDGDTDYVQILTIYKGYLIEFEMEPSKDAAERSLTDEQIQMCVDFLSNLDFVEVKS
jgi:uncharacterized protein YraI